MPLTATISTFLLFLLLRYPVAFVFIYSTVNSFPTHLYPNTTSDMNKKSHGQLDSHKERNNVNDSIKSKIITLSRTLRNPLGVASFPFQNKKPEMYYTKNGVKRGLDIEFNLKFPPTQKSTDNLNKLEDMLKDALGGSLGEALNTSCQNCEKDEEGFVAPARRRVKPAYKCDDWDAKLRLCVLERNIGDTVTFYLSTGDFKGHKPNVTWRKEFHMMDTEIRTEFVIYPENSPQNIIIGKQGYELRVSPVTEIDVGYNLFSATISGHLSRQSKVYFVIRIVPVDLGFVYVGETIELNLRSFLSLPSEALTFKWYMEKYGEHGTLPSNMRTSGSGSSIKISELRQEQEGILACSVYTNLNFLATKKRFLIKDLVKNKDVLQSAPDHNLTFKEEQPDRRKRDPKKLVRHKREINIDDIVNKALESTTTKIPVMKITTREAISRSYSDYDIEDAIGKGEPRVKDFDSFDNSDEFENRYQDLNEDLTDRSPPTKQFSAENRVEVDGPEESGPILGYSQLQNINEGISPQLGTSVLNQLGRNSLKQHSANQELNPQESYPKYQKHKENGHEAPEEQKPTFLKKTVDDVKKQVDTYSNKDRYGIQTEDSEIILNIDKIPGPRRISAEENIAKLISSCYTDFECSAAATCVRTNLKQKGFCKCLPGYYGVGIFCREDIWLSKSNFDLEEVHSPEDGPPALQDNI